MLISKVMKDLTSETLVETIEYTDDVDTVGDEV